MQNVAPEAAIMGSKEVERAANNPMLEVKRVPLNDGLHASLIPGERLHLKAGAAQWRGRSAEVGGKAGFTWAILFRQFHHSRTEVQILPGAFTPRTLGIGDETEKSLCEVGARCELHLQDAHSSALITEALRAMQQL